MGEFLDAALGASASSLHVQFAAFVIMGLAVGWGLGQSGRWGGWSPTLAIMGVCGAWLGAEMACLIGQATRGGATEFAAAFLGAAALAYAWRRRHPPLSERPDHIALGRFSA